MIQLHQPDCHNITALADRLRPEDVQELYVLTRSTPLEGLVRSVAWSAQSYVVFADGAPLMAFGVGGDALARCGSPWCLTAPVPRKYHRQLIGAGRSIVRGWLEEYRRLENVVEARNTSAQRFIAALGFEIGPPQRYPSGAAGRPFWLEGLYV